MKAVVLTAPRRLEVVELPEPVPGAGEALVQLHAAGICGTDLHGWAGDNPLLSLPRIQGHEVVGTVLAGGPWPPGTPVCVNPMLTCGVCRACRVGRRNCCAAMRVFGVHLDGGFRERFTIPVDLLVPLPAGLPLELGALVEPLSIGAQATARAEVTAGEPVLILGAGAIGLCCLLLARAAGARVIIADALPKRLALATALGAEAVIDVTREDDKARVLEFCGGEGPGCVIEAAGRASALARAIDLAGPAAVVVSLMISREELRLPVTATLIRKELDLRGSRLNRDRFGQVLDLLASGAIDPTPLITARYPLTAAPAAFALATGEAERQVKVLLRAGA